MHRGAMQTSRPLEQDALRSTPADEAHAERQAIATESGRHGHAREIQEIHEIRVVAELRVETNRVRLDARDFVDGPRGGREQEICRRPGSLARSSKRLQAVQAFECVHRGEACTRLDDWRVTGCKTSGLRFMMSSTAA